MTTWRSPAVVLCVLTTGLIGPQASAQDPWQPLPAANVLLVETTKGRILVEMRPDLAPTAVARITQLTRERVYDGLQFHRVVARFVAQTGNPDNRDGGVSRHPNLTPEFTARLTPNRLRPAATTTSDGTTGFLGSVPVQGEGTRGRADGTFRAWGAYCTGVAGMGRQAARDSANSEIFFMLEPARSLDHEYTVWGRIVDGLPVLQSLAVGEPPATPDVMTRVRVLADMPSAERPVVSLNPVELSAQLRRLRATRGADFTICDVDVPVRVSAPASR